MNLTKILKIFGRNKTIKQNKSKKTVKQQEVSLGDELRETLNVQGILNFLENSHDLLSYIFGFLTLEDLLLIISSVCKEWKILVDSGKVFNSTSWKERCFEIVDGILERIRSESKDIQREKLDQLISFVSKIIRYFPNDPRLYLHRASLLLRKLPLSTLQKELEKALDQFSSQDDKELPYIYVLIMVLLGIIYFIHFDYDKAQQHLQKANEVRVEFVQPFLNWTSHTQVAYEDIIRALELDPDMELAKNIQIVLEKVKDYHPKRPTSTRYIKRMTFLNK